jgi:hypothetical protein
MLNCFCSLSRYATDNVSCLSYSNLVLVSVRASQRTQSVSIIKTMTTLKRALGFTSNAFFGPILNKIVRHCSVLTAIPKYEISRNSVLWKWSRHMPRGGQTYIRKLRVAFGTRTHLRLAVSNWNTNTSRSAGV